MFFWAGKIDNKMTGIAEMISKRCKAVGANQLDYLIGVIEKFPKFNILKEMKMQDELCELNYFFFPIY